MQSIEIQPDKSQVTGQHRCQANTNAVWSVAESVHLGGESGSELRFWNQAAWFPDHWHHLLAV